MTTFNTGNPVPSADAKDRYDNSQTLDELVNGPGDSYRNRLGVSLKSMVGITHDLEAAIQAAGYAFLGDYDDGPLTITLQNQVFSKGGEFWRAKASLDLPYTTAQNWALDIDRFVSVGDAYLRQLLASSEGSTYVTHTQLGGISRTLQNKLEGLVTPEDFASQAAAMQAMFTDPNKFYVNNRESFTITVGDGGDVPTLNAAINAACRMRPTHAQGMSSCSIRLLSGFVMREQVLVRDGCDLGWLKISADDALTLIDHAAITEALSPEDDSYPAFGAIDNSTLPVIDCKFQYANNATAKDGVAVLSRSKCLMYPFSGVVNAKRGCLSLYGSDIACYPLGLTQGGDGVGAGTDLGVDFSKASRRGLHVAYGSRAALGRSKFDHCDGDIAIYVIWASMADVYHTNASYCAKGTAFLSRDGSFVNARESNASHSQRGFHAVHNGRINARSRTSGAAMIWVGEGAQHCTQYGVLASGNSQIEASELNASFCTGSAGVSASDTSTVSFIDGVATDCTNRGVWAQNGSVISAVRADVSRSKTGIEAMSATVSATGLKAVGCPNFGILAYSSGHIEASTSAAILTGCGRAAEARDGSSVNVRGANLSGAIERAVSAIDGGRINCMEANLTGAGSRGISCRGGDVVATNANCSGAVNWAVEVLDGGIVKFARGIRGSSPLNVTENTISADGIIFYSA